MQSYEEVTVGLYDQTLRTTPWPIERITDRVIRYSTDPPKWEDRGSNNSLGYTKEDLTENGLDNSSFATLLARPAFEKLTKPGHSVRSTFNIYQQASCLPTHPTVRSGWMTSPTSSDIWSVAD